MLIWRGENEDLQQYVLIFSTLVNKNIDSRYKSLGHQISLNSLQKIRIPDTYPQFSEILSELYDKSLTEYEYVYYHLHSFTSRLLWAVERRQLNLLPSGNYTD